MAKQSIFGRISTLVRANINAMLDSAEDPQKMLDQLVRDYTNSIADAESAIAETIGNLRLLERDHQEDVQAAAEWGNKALAASRRPTSCARAGSTADADKFDNLAKIALQRQISAEREAKAVEPTIAVADRGRRQAQGRPQRHEAEARAAEVASAASCSRARRPPRRRTRSHDAVKSIDVLDPTSELGRFEDKVRRQEALAAGKQELAASSLDAQFNSLDDVGELTEVEARLAALKAGAAPAQQAIDAPTRAVHAVAASRTGGDSRVSARSRAHRPVRFAHGGSIRAEAPHGCERMSTWPDS